MNDKERINILSAMKLSEQKIHETLKNENVTNTILCVAEEAIKQGCNLEDAGRLLYHLATTIKPQIFKHLTLLINYIATKKIQTSLQIDAAILYLLSHAHETIDIDQLNNECGVGVVITPEDIEIAVEKAINVYKNEILAKRYRFNQGPMLQEIRKTLKWADFKDVMNEIDVQLVDMLGPKTDDDRRPLDKVKKKKVVVKNVDNSLCMNNINNNGDNVADMISKLNLHKPGENFKSEGYIITENTKKLLEEHLKLTNGQVRTRFPPEPNGILHIGHAKAININFGYAHIHKGICFLRFDDTNPEKEEEKFFKGILEMVKWLGYEPYKITHSSDYFDQLYLWAVELIKLGQAYVCHQSQTEIQGFNAPVSPYRDRSVEENLILFQDMKRGKMNEGECTLRMKITLEEGKRDPVAYRIKYMAHPKTGDKWCIYPTYDYTHCLCDSLEHITHSLCTKEFQSRRSSYYWLCNTLNIYCPVQWEYGRLNMNYTIVSKRKIAKLIELGIVNDWDDPRLFTLTALRRRGLPAAAINKFCAKIGATGAQTVVDPVMLDACARDILNQIAPRTMAVFNPLQINIVKGLESNNMFINNITVPNFPNNPEQGQHCVTFTQTLFIDADDFKLENESGFKRLTNNQTVGLRYTPYLIKILEIIYSDNQKEIKSINVEAIKVNQTNKPKAFIHWVCEPIVATVRLYTNLFKHSNPEDLNEVPQGYLTDIQPNSLQTQQIFIDKYIINEAKPFDHYQFERVGYFNIDPDSIIQQQGEKHATLIFNRTILLKEDPTKN